MDAVKFIEGCQRMCRSFGYGCAGCPADDTHGGCKLSFFKGDTAVEQIKLLKEWLASHPITTRADIFKKAYPNAETDSDGILVICPKHMDKALTCPVGMNCWQCRQEYWMKEVE